METFVALYDDFANARAAVETLVDYGVTRDNISMVANDVAGEHGQYVTSADAAAAVTEDVKPDQGAGFGAVVGTLIGLGTALIPGVGPVLAAGPAFAALFAGIGAAAGAATGGLTASLVDLGTPEETAGYYAEGIRRGGTLVTVHASDDQITRVRQILNDYKPANIDERAEEYVASGYTGYDPNGAPYTRDQVQAERSRRYSNSTIDDLD